MNYRKTAERLNMTQPGVTQHIKLLESRYGVKLFEYNGRQLRRTEAAERLKSYLDLVRAEEAALREQFAARDVLRLRVGATKTIGEFVIVDKIKEFLSEENRELELLVDNTEHLLAMLERGELDFAIIEGVFDKAKYPHHLYKKENFLGICSKNHPFAGRKVSIEELFGESLVVREKGSGTRRLLEQAVEDRGHSLSAFRRCSVLSNFALICNLVAEEGAITFAYEPISRCRADLTTFMVEDMHIKGEFNFVYISETTARPLTVFFED
ncbi:MAG: LysR family transcriptional regulator [Oscillospiraceae bacterium]|nr:LysR family transcriptional regulator [Oscillospiraceae bacterium]